jgi:hypothetical protein
MCELWGAGIHVWGTQAADEARIRHKSRIFPSFRLLSKYAGALLWQTYNDRPMLPLLIAKSAWRTLIAAAFAN